MFVEVEMGSINFGNKFLESICEGNMHDNLWSSILNEVQKQGSKKLASNKCVLVLGDNASGKTTLIAKLQGVEDPKKGAGLEYAYIDVKDDYRDDVTRLGVWVLDGDPGHTNLLKFALNEKNYAHTLVILTVSMKTPWSWLEQLHHWTKVLANHIEKLSLEKEEKQEVKQRIISAWQGYCELGDDLDPVSPMKRSARMSSLDDEDMLPLPEGVLTTNLGLDIVIVVTKTDYMSTLEKEYDYRDEHFDFMQQWIRRFSLQYGASLFYTSVKEDKNCDLLYKYLTHRIYGMPFRTPALVVEKDAVLIPSGWDNLKKISILYENMHSCRPEDYFTDVIAAPTSRKDALSRETEVQTEEEQLFLMKQQQILQHGHPRGESPLRTQAAKSLQRTPGGQASPKKADVKLTPSTPGGEGVLANFFNSLLHKKSGSPSATTLTATRISNAGESGPNSTLRNESSELDRIVKKRELEFAQPDC